MDLQTNYMHLAALQLSGTSTPKPWQYYIGFRMLQRDTIKRHKLGLCTKQHLVEYRQAKHYLITQHNFKALSQKHNHSRLMFIANTKQTNCTG